jgi:hypothetical protein
MVTRNPAGQHNPMMQAVQKLDAIKELIRSDKRDDFITMLNFPSREIGIAFCQCLDKCLVYGLTDELDYIWHLGMSMVADKGHRAMMFSQTVANLLVPEFYGGKDVQSNRDKGIPAAPNK